MRISVTINGKATTISVDDTLIDYLGAALVMPAPKLHGSAKIQQDKAKQFIRDEILSSPAMPDKDISQFVQRRIIKLIAADGLDTIIEVRGPRFRREKLKFDVAAYLGVDEVEANRLSEAAKAGTISIQQLGEIRRKHIEN